MNIVNAYAPSSDTERRTFFSDLEQFLLRDYDNIIGGVFNCSMDVRQDKLGGNVGARKSVSTVLRTLNVRFYLIDVWRDCHQGQRNYTWTGRNPTDNSLITTRIDFFLVGPAYKPFITSTDIRPYVHSDHDCISLTFDLEKVNRGPAYWHFNNELLTDAVFQGEIEEFWADWKQKFQEFPDPLQWWDEAKQNFKSIAIKRAKIRRKVQCHQRFHLENKLKRTQELAKNGTTRDIEQYLLAQENLKQLELKELESNKIRAKAQFMEEGEKSTLYFLSLEKSRRKNQIIRVLTKDNLDTVTEIQDLLSETRTFCQNL